MGKLYYSPQKALVMALIGGSGRFWQVFFFCLFSFVHHCYIKKKCLIRFKYIVDIESLLMNRIKRQFHFIATVLDFFCSSQLKCASFLSLVLTHVHTYKHTHRCITEATLWPNLANMQPYCILVIHLTNVAVLSLLVLLLTNCDVLTSVPFYGWWSLAWKSQTELEFTI